MSKYGASGPPPSYTGNEPISPPPAHVQSPPPLDMYGGGSPSPYQNQAQNYPPRNGDYYAPGPGPQMPSPGPQPYGQQPYPGGQQYPQPGYGGGYTMQQGPGYYPQQGYRQQGGFYDNRNTSGSGGFMEALLASLACCCCLECLLC